jgi:hypothetical protein
MPDEQHDSDTVLHQDAHEAIVEDVLSGADDGGTPNEAIDDLVEITGGQSPTEAEHNLVVVAVNDILAALRNSGVIPESEEV